MPVKFELTAEDWWDAYRFATGRRRFFARLRVFLLGLIVSGILASPLVLRSQNYQVGWLLVTLAGATLYSPLSARLSFLRFKSIYKRALQENKSSELAITVDKAGLWFPASRGATHQPWSSFSSFAESKHCLLLYNEGKVSAIIPKRVLTPSQQIKLRLGIRSLVRAAS